MGGVYQRGGSGVSQQNSRPSTTQVLAEANSLLESMRLRSALGLLDSIGPERERRAEILQLKAFILVQLGYFADAGAVLDQITGPGNNDEEYARLRVHVTLGLGDTVKAVSESTALLRRYPSSVPGWCVHADALAADGAGEAARGALLKAAEIGKTDLDVVNTALTIEDFDVARMVLDAHQRMSPDALGHFLQALIELTVNGDSGACQTELDAGRRLDADHPFGSFIAASLLVSRGDREAAIRAIDRALSELDGPALRTIRGLLYQDEGRFDEALHEADFALGHTPYSLEALTLRAGLLARRGAWSAVVRDASRVLDKNPDHTEARILRAMAHLEQQRTELARRDAAAILAVNPHDGDALFLQAKISFAEGAYPQALKEINEAIAVQGETVEKLLLRIWVQVKMGGQHAAAVRDIKAILRIDPGNAMGLKLLNAEKEARASQWGNLAKAIGRVFRGL